MKKGISYTFLIKILLPIISNYFETLWEKGD